MRKEVSSGIPVAKSAEMAERAATSARRPRGGPPPVPVACDAERQLELKREFIDQLRHGDGEESDLALAGMVCESRAGELDGDLGQGEGRRYRDGQRQRAGDRAHAGE